MSSRGLSKVEVASLLAQLESLLAGLSTGELAARSNTQARVEGAIVALSVVLGSASAEDLIARLGDSQPNT